MRFHTSLSKTIKVNLIGTVIAVGLISFQNCSPARNEGGTDSSDIFRSASTAGSIKMASNISESSSFASSNSARPVEIVQNINSPINASGFGVSSRSNGVDSSQVIGWATSNASGALTAWDAVQGVAHATSGGTAHSVTGVSGYVLNSNPIIHSWPAATAVFAWGVADADNTSTWGFSGLLTDHKALGPVNEPNAIGRRLFYENDCDIKSLQTICAGLNIGGTWYVPNQKSTGVTVWKPNNALEYPNVNGKWAYAFGAQDGATSEWGFVGASEVSGRDIPSQSINFRTYDEASNLKVATLKATATQFQLSSMGSDMGLSLPNGSLFANGHIFATNGRLLSRVNANGTSDDAGGSVNLQNPSKTEGHSWILYNMGKGYGSGLQLWEYPATEPRVTFAEGGKVGIGLVNPRFQLQLATDSAAKPGSSSWTIASDERLKEIRAPFTRGLDAINGLNAIYFNYKNNNPLELPSEKEYVGIKAQDAQRVIPEAVSIDKQGYLHVTIDSIIWTAVNAIKELYSKVLGHDVHLAQQARSIASKADKAEIEALKINNQKLEQENIKIKARLDEIEKMLRSK